MSKATIDIQDVIASGIQVCKADSYEIGDAWSTVPYGCIAAQQGDVYLWKCAGLPENCIPVKPYRQLAPGATLGSRHCLASLDGVEMFHLLRPGPLDGPILRFAQPGTITHPTHGDIVGFPAGAIVRVTYQRMYADEVRRVED